MELGWLFKLEAMVIILILLFELPQVDPVSVAATANSQVPPAFDHGQGQGQPPNGNANVNAQGEYMRLITQPNIHIPQYLLHLHLSHFPAMYLSPFY